MSEDVLAYVGLTLGVIIAVLYPVLWGHFRQVWPAQAAPGLPDWARKYLLLLAFSLVTAFVLLVIFRNANPTAILSFYQAVFLGFGWEASIEKIFNPPKAPVAPNIQVPARPPRGAQA